MSALSIQPTYPIFTETDGLPLENGYIWIGTANLDPQGNPINVYWDAALTIAAPQPIRTLNGYPSRNGTPARMYVNSDYSIRVQDKNGSMIYSAPEALERYSADLVSFTGFKGQAGTVQDLADNDGSDWIGFIQLGGSAIARSAQDKMRDLVSVKDFGAVGDSSTDDTAALNACALYCLNNDKTMFIPAGVYKITSTITASCSIAGVGPMTSVIKNYGTGDALDLSGSVYYTTFENFGVDGSGNIASRDGISLYNTTTSSGNPAYCHFFNVYSYNNGRHGLYHRYAWGTRYSQCKFHYNGRLGVFLNTVIPGDIGGPNGVTFFQCDSRHNGGAISGFGSDAGGIKVQGASVVSWIGGVIESNNGYGVYVGDAPGGASSRLVHFKQTYFEYNGYDVAIGALLYATGPWANIVVEDCWLSYGANTGNTNTLFYIQASLDNGNFVEKNNTYVPLGAGTVNKYAGTHFAGPQLAVGTAPTVFAYTNATTALSVPTATFTKIIFDQEPWDTNQNFNMVTSRFTPTIAGYYRLSARVNGFPAAGVSFWISVYQNGTESFRGQQLNSANIGAVVDCLQYANGSTDYFEIYIFQASGSTQSYTPGFNQCSLQIEYVRNT